MTRKSLIVVLAVVLVSAPLLGPAATGISAADATQSSPDGMVGVPDSNISMEVPDGESVPLEASDLQDRIYVDQYASSLEVVVTTPEHADEMLSSGDDANVIGSGEVAVVVRDSEHHSGRDIAVDASLLKNTLGYSPEMLFGTHSSGETWRSPATYEDGYLQFHVEKFSSNAVTFSGEVSVTGTYGDDSSVQYNLSELDSASDPVVNLTGVVNSEWDNETASLTDGSMDVALSGTEPLSGPDGSPSVTFEGSTESWTETASGSTTNTSETVSLDTFTEGDANAAENAQIELSALPALSSSKSFEFGNRPSWDAGSGSDLKEKSITQDVAGVSAVRMEVDDSQAAGTWYLYLAAGGTDGSQTGEKFGEINDCCSGGESRETQSWDTSGVSTSIRTADTVHVEVVRQSQSDGTMTLYDMHIDGATASSADVSVDGGGTGGTFDMGTSSLSLTGDTTAVDVTSQLGRVEANLSYEASKYANSPSVTADSTGASASYSGYLAEGETVTKPLDVTRSDSTLDVSTASGSGPVSVTLHVQERTGTSDAGLGLNTDGGGAWANHTGVLSDGETVSLDLPQSALQEGTNTLDVAAGDGSLSADAPAPKVDVEYSHDAAAEKSVDYVSEQLSERYNVSHTYATDREDASLTVPFATDVVEIRSVEKRVDGGDWQTVPESEYVLDNTTMDVSLGSVDAETQVDVRAVGGTVDARDMSIDVLDPSDPGERLDSKIEVSNVGSNPRLDFGDRRIAYAYDEAWTGEDSARFDGNGQMLRLPNAGEGGTFRVSTIPVEPEPQTGDVDISVSEAKTTEPTFNVEPGASSGDDVEYTYLNAQDGEPYILYSVTDSVVHDDGTASSPVTLEDDDSKETLQFRIDNGSTSSSGESDGGMGDVLGPIRNNQQSGPMVNIDFGSTWLLLLGGGGVLMLGGIYWRSGSEGVANTTRTAASGLQSGASWSARALSRSSRWLGSHPYVAAGLAAIASFGLVASGLVSLPQGAGTFLLVVVTPAIAYVVLVQQLGASPLIWGILTAVSVVLGFQLLGTDVFTVLADSQAFPILAVGGVYLAYQAIQTYRASSTAPEEENTIVFDTGDDGNGGGGS